MQDGFFAGLDFGISSASISIINSKKKLTYSNSVQYKDDFKNPNSWIDSCEKVLHGIPLDIKTNIVKLAISGTYGTFTASSLQGEPLGKSITFYQGSNKNTTTIELKNVGVDNLQNIHNKLSKAGKIMEKYGENILLRHQADWIAGWFLKDWRCGGEDNNLSIGWDIIKESWPQSHLKNSFQKCLPQIIKSGEMMGQIDSELAKRFNLNKRLILISGTTDSNAAFLSAELDKDEGLTVLGDTMIIKKINKNPIIGEGITNYRVCGNWICEGDINSGYRILSKFFSDLEIKEISRQINASKKTFINLLPLYSRGKRFPFHNPSLEPILSPRPVSDSLYLHALFEGLARIEYIGWEKLYELTGSIPKRIVTIGLGSRNPQWRLIREKIIKIPIVSCKKTNSFGTALLAINGKK